MKFEKKVDLATTILIIGFSVSMFIYHILLARYFDVSINQATFLFLKEDRFNDFFNVLRISKEGAQYLNDSALSTNTYLTANYFPFAFFLTGTFNIKPNTFFCIFLISFVLTNLYIVNYFLKENFNEMEKHKKYLNIFTLTFLTYPFLYLIDRANLEGFIFIFLSGFLLALLKKRFGIAAVFLALASAMKLYPCILGLLFIKNKEYKYLTISALLTLLISVVSMLTFKGSFMENINGLMRELSHFQSIYTLAPSTSHSNGLSLFGIMKLIFFKSSWYNVYKLYFIFNLIAVTMLGFITFFILKMEKELWKQVMLLISFTILFMGTSFEYKLISVLLPFYLFLQSKEKSNYDILYVILFSILLIPKKLFAGHGGFSFSISETIDSIILIYINALIITESKGKKIKNLFT